MQQQYRDSTLAVVAAATAGALVTAGTAAEPLLVPALLLAIGLVVLCFKRPLLALKLMLLSGGMPLDTIGMDANNPAQKPLLTDLGGTSIDGLRLVLVSTVLLFLCARVGCRKMSRYLWLYVGFLAILGSTLLFSPSRIDGLRIVLKVLYPFLILLASLVFLKTREDIWSAVRYWIAGGITASVIGLALLVVRGSQSLVVDGDFRYTSGLTHSNPYSMYMLMLFLLCYSIWRKLGNTGYGWLALVFSIQAVLCNSRITWAATLLGVTLLEASWGKGLKKWMRTVTLSASATAALILMIWCTPTLQQRVFSDGFDSGAPAAEMAANINTAGRLVLWHELFEDYWEHNRWIGQGAGSSDNFLRSYGEIGIVPHNEYLRILHDAGVVGLASFVVATTALFVLLRFLITGPLGGTATALFIQVAVAGLGAYLVECLTDNPLQYYLEFTQYVFFLIGVSIVLASRHTLPCVDLGPDPSESRPRSPSCASASAEI
jgi:hypothetical protein